jgi:hypothetical protein
MKTQASRLSWLTCQQLADLNVINGRIEMTNGWKTWAPARCGRLLLLCAGLAVAQTALAEPSEAQMRAAIEAKFGNVNAGADETAQRCNNREYNRGQGDSVLAMQCLMYGIGGGVTNGGRNVRAPQFKLTRFEKIACEKAQGKAGYLCDYVMGYGSNMASNSPAIEGMMRSGAATQGRFVKRDGGWIALDN